MFLPIKNEWKNTLRILFVLSFVSPQAYAQDIESLVGVWGTEAQCSGSLITPKGTKRAEPFDLQSDWLGHGGVWCRLNWWSSSPTDADGRTAIAQAVCGEDGERDYQLRFNLDGDALTIIWNWQFKNGPLRRCS